MLKYLSQNKHVILIAVALFVVSMSTLLFFLGSNTETQQHEIKTDLLENSKVKSLNDTEDYYRKLVNNHEDSILALALDGSIEFASLDTESKWGYGKKDILNQSIFVLLHPDDLPDFLGVFGKVLQTEHSVNTMGPYRVRGKDSGYRIIIGLATPLMEKGKIQKIIITAKDITDGLAEKSNENDLKQQKHRPVDKKKRPTIDETQQPVEGKIIADK